MTGPPHAPQPPKRAATEVPREENHSQSTPRCPTPCVTCELGIQPWTKARREEALAYSLRAGRRIIDLEDVR